MDDGTVRNAVAIHYGSHANTGSSLSYTTDDFGNAATTDTADTATYGAANCYDGRIIWST